MSFIISTTGEGFCFYNKPFKKSNKRSDNIISYKESFGGE